MNDNLGRQFLIIWLAIGLAAGFFLGRGTAPTMVVSDEPQASAALACPPCRGDDTAATMKRLNRPLPSMLEPRPRAGLRDGSSLVSGTREARLSAMGARRESLAARLAMAPALPMPQEPATPPRSLPPRFAEDALTTGVAGAMAESDWGDLIAVECSEHPCLVYLASRRPMNDQAWLAARASLLPLLERAGYPGDGYALMREDLSLGEAPMRPRLLSLAFVSSDYPPDPVVLERMRVRRQWLVRGVSAPQ